MTLLAALTISGEDFRAFANNPHGLMELGFEEPLLCTTVFPRLMSRKAILIGPNSDRDIELALRQQVYLYDLHGSGYCLWASGELCACYPNGVILKQRFIPTLSRVSACFRQCGL